MKINDLYIKPDIERGIACVSFSAPAGASGAAWRLSASADIIAEGRIEAASGPVSFAVEVPDCRLWSAGSPFLYNLELDVEGNGEAVSLKQDFGMYKISVSGDKIYFNGEPLYIKGVIRGREAHDHPNLCGLADEEYYARYISRAKDYGFNFIRFHSKIPPESYFAAANRLGMLTHVEIRPYFGKYQKERAAMDAQPELVDEKEWREAIMRLRNHPSVLVYCLGNEINEPGKNPEVAKLYTAAKELDPQRLFLDTCSRGEFDRENVDIDVQHMSYFAPFGHSYRMFETPEHTNIYGSCRGLEMESGEGPARTVRHVNRPWPLLAHEVCHYAALRDIDRLDDDFASCGAEKPWWIDELKKLRTLKGLDDYYSLILEASRRYQYIWWKQCLESVRRSPILQGFHMLQLSDTERYENSNGLLDPFDQPQWLPKEDFLKFNADTVVLADLPERCFRAGEHIEVPVLLSHYDRCLRGEAGLEWSLVDRDSGEELLKGGMSRFSLDESGLRKLCTLKLVVPEISSHRALELIIRLVPSEGVPVVNSWNIWAFAHRGGIPSWGRFVSGVQSLNLKAHYPCCDGDPANSKLFVAEKFSEEVFDHLGGGGDVLMLYRVPENRSASADREDYYLPSTRDRFKGVIWDRGHNCGAFMRESPLWKHFPNDGFVDFSFANLIDDADKVDLSDFPVRIMPLMEGVDKATRDRYDVHKFGLSELQPGWTMRRFAYVFEVKTGRGRLLLTGLNFTGLERGLPEARAMLDGLISYVCSEDFMPEALITVEELRSYLAEKGRSPRIKERMMTQYWQLDAEPLETARFWKESEAYLREDG